MSSVSLPRKPEPIHLSELSANPLHSVLISNYNYGRFLPGAIVSVLRQSFQNWELVVCDDGSTDGSSAMLDELERCDPRIRVLTKENGGQASAWNAAFERTSGVIISFLDPDDRFRPDKLQRVVSAFAAHPQAGLVYHQFQPTTIHGDPIGQPFPRDLESGWLADAAQRRGGWGPGSTTSVLSIRRELAELVFPIPSHFWRGFGDAFIQGVSQFLTNIVCIDAPLTDYCIHGGNLVAFVYPNIDNIRLMVDARRETFPRIQSFVAEHCGSDVAAELHLEDIPSYWEYLAAHYVMAGAPSNGTFGYTADELIRHLPNSRRKGLWRILFRMPAWISIRLFANWWGQPRWKRVARPVTMRLGLK